VLGTFARLVEPEKIADVASAWIADVAALHAELALLPSPYGDGTASDRVVASIRRLVTGA
jgi:UDP-N-acetylglucosamine 2-epimerase (non-hydrolysing)